MKTLSFCKIQGRERAPLWHCYLPCILTVIEPDQTDRVLSAIDEAMELQLPGRGIAFVIALPRVAGGRVHMVCRLDDEKDKKTG
jgi:hypothetical protein